MKKKIAVSIVMVIVMLAGVVFAVNSMLYGNIDATWGYVDKGPADPTPNPRFWDGADCLRYGDGPVGTKLDPNDFTDSTYVLNTSDPSIQNPNKTNWNQVRYGRPSGTYYSDCSTNNNLTQFRRQSGLAFNGVDERNPKREASMGVPFSLGKMCHINNPIYTDNGNDFNMTYADLSIHGVECGPGGTLVKNKAGDPYNPAITSINLDYRFMVAFEETENSGSCTYPSTSPCADAVTPGQAQGNHFFCKYTAPDGTTNVVENIIAFVGFTHIDVTGANASCENATYDASQTMPGIFISQEGATNCACVWAQITESVPAAVDMNYFTVEGGFESIILRWQTAFETDNIGFNVYRSESLLRENAVQLNQELIKSLVPPGSTYGADYEFVDTSAKPYRTYFYWIEDVDVNGTITSHGPMGAEWVDQLADCSETGSYLPVYRLNTLQNYGGGLAGLPLFIVRT